MSLLTIAQAACGELGLPVPVQLFGAQDKLDIQVLALAQREGKELSGYPVKDSRWQSLQKLYLFNTAFATYTGTTTLGSNVVTGLVQTGGSPGAAPGIGWGVAGTNLPNACTASAFGGGTVTLDPTQLATLSGAGTFTLSQIAYALPADYDSTVNQTMWDRTFRWQMLGPLSAQEWQVLKSGIAPTGPRMRWRIDLNKFYLDPYPTQVDQLAFEYISNGWCQSASLVAQNAWAADTDTGVISEDLMTLGLKWRLLRAKGLSYAEERETYDMAVERAAARDGGVRTLMLNRVSISPLLQNANIPDTGFGVPSA